MKLSYFREEAGWKPGSKTPTRGPLELDLLVGTAKYHCREHEEGADPVTDGVHTLYSARLAWENISDAFLVPVP